MARKKDSYDYQLDLTPFISLLSVCICFLLVTVAWYQVGSITMKQVMGGDTSEAASPSNQPALWIHMESKKRVLIKVKQGKKSISQKIIVSKNSESDFDHEQFQKHILSLKKQIPNLEQAFILPKKHIVYEDVIRIMDGIRHAGIISLGLSPI